MNVHHRASSIGSTLLSLKYILFPAVCLKRSPRCFFFFFAACLLFLWHGGQLPVGEMHEIHPGALLTPMQNHNLHPAKLFHPGPFIRAVSLLLCIA